MISCPSAAAPSPPPSGIARRHSLVAPSSPTFKVAPSDTALLALSPVKVRVATLAAPSTLSTVEGASSDGEEAEAEAEEGTSIRSTDNVPSAEATQLSKGETKQGSFRCRTGKVAPGATSIATDGEEESEEVANEMPRPRERQAAEEAAGTYIRTEKKKGKNKKREV